MFNNMLMGAAGESIKSTGGFQVNNSVVLNEPDDEYFTRTPTSASNQKTWTFSTWIKRGELGADRRIFTATNNGCELFFDANDKLNSYQYTSGSYVWNYITTQVFRDPHAWFHLVVRIDTTQASSGDRVRLYVNGEQITAFDTSTAPSQDATGFVNSAVAHYIGRYSGSDSMHYDGYLAETILIDGSSLAPTSFGETDSNGVWRPISIEDAGLTFGTNGFYLQFATAAGLGQDSSGSSSTTVVQKNTYNAGSEINDGDSSANPSTGMLFTAPVSGTISKIELNASSRGFSGVTVRLETDGGSGTAPSGTIVTNGEVTGITSSGAGLKTATFSTPPEVTAGVKYWIVLRGDTGTWGWQHDVAGSGGALGLYQGALGYFSGRGVGHYVYMNGNHWTPVNSPTQTTDTPTDNHATWSPIISYNKGVAFSEGNSRSTTSTTAGDVGGLISGFELPTSGKYYWEWVTNTVGTTPLLGWRDITTWSPTSYTSSEVNAAKFITGTDYNTGSGRILSSTIDGSTSLSQAAYGNFLTVSGGNPLANGTVLGCAYDADNGLAWFSYNNTWVDGNGTDSSSTVKGEIEAGTSGSQAFTTANGAVGEAGLFITASVQSVSSGDFTLRTRSDQWTGDCPSGFTALSTKNQAAAVTFAIEDGSAHFQATAYTGNGSANNDIAQTGNSSFQPDMVWGKNRTLGDHGHRLYDAIRGVTKVLQPSAHDAEATDSDGLTAFNSNGFEVGSGNHLNGNTNSIIGWQWLAGNATSTPSGGSVSSTVSVNQTAGFSIVSWTGTGANATVAHGLGAVPEWILVKNRDSAGNNWATYHVGQNNTHVSFLDSANAMSAADRWQDTTPTSTVFSVDGTTDVNKLNDDMIAYCWCGKPGFSKFGTFEGNGSSTDGPFIPLGFKPAWFMWKNIDSGTNGDWTIMDAARDPFNMVEDNLRANSTMASDTGEADLDFLSNGVKHRGGASARFNASATYIYMAFAEHPFAGTTPATAR